MKRIISTLLSVFLLALTLPFTASAETEIPEGFTPIYTIEDLDNVRNNSGGKFIMMNDLDLAGIDWVPISTFSGTFDGNGYVILNLTVSGYDYGGLWGRIYGGALIQNLGIVNCTIDAVKSAGGIAGSHPPVNMMLGVIITNCSVTGSIYSSGIAGGMIGSIEGSFMPNMFPPVVIKDCYTMAQVSGGRAGGIFGDSPGPGTCPVDVFSSYFGGSSSRSPLGNTYGGNYAAGKLEGFYFLDTSAPESYVPLPPPYSPTALTDAQMRQQVSFEGFDFSETGPWVMPTDGGYPVLKIFVRESEPEPIPDPCWARLPCWVQWILRWVCFGWIWM